MGQPIFITSGQIDLTFEEDSNFRIILPSTLLLEVVKKYFYENYPTEKSDFEYQIIKQQSV